MTDAALYLSTWADSWAQSWKASLQEALADDESGQGMVEYGLVLALVAIAAIVALGFLSGTIQSTFMDTGSAIRATPVRVATPTP